MSSQNAVHSRMAHRRGDDVHQHIAHAMGNDRHRTPPLHHMSSSHALAEEALFSTLVCKCMHLATIMQAGRAAS